MDAPLVGVNTSYEETSRVGALRGRAFVNDEYPEAVRKAGGIPVLFPPTRNLDEVRRWIPRVAAFVFIGSDDLTPERFGESRHPKATYLSPVRENSDLALAAAVVDGTALPVLGICGGLQLINVIRGGSLWQDIPDLLGTRVPHRAEHNQPYARHSIDVEAGSRLEILTGLRRFEVNSFHHQAVKKVGRGLRVTARTEDGVVEALEGEDPGRFLLSVQWHPEYLHYPEYELGLFRGLLEAARKDPALPR